QEQACGDVPLPRLRESQDAITRSVQTGGRERVRATRNFAKPAARVFAMPADSTTHSTIDAWRAKTTTPSREAQASQT
ncbi:MAG: hypothetical protein M3281_04600, partial [Chloroflexota bacterium]|nr:hypothetical protein [Chloroflexota bacterium]